MCLTEPQQTIPQNFTEFLHSISTVRFIQAQRKLLTIPFQQDSRRQPTPHKSNFNLQFSFNDLESKRETEKFYHFTKYIFIKLVWLSKKTARSLTTKLRFTKCHQTKNVKDVIQYSAQRILF